MVQILKNNNFYQNSVSPGRRESLLLIYLDYISLVKTMEEFYHQYSLQEIAQNGAEKIYGANKSPWQVSAAKTQDEEDYKNFVNNESINRENHNCYISLNLTSPSSLKTGKDILSAPQDYVIWRQGNTLPHRIERITAAAQVDEKLTDTRFIIEGKYIAKYKEKDPSVKLTDALNSEEFKNKLNCMLDCLTRYPEDIQQLSPQKNKQIKTEVMAAAAISPLESTILDTLSLLADETHKIVRTLLEKRVGNRFLAQAEKEGLIKSASTLQDYLNIRHLIHHQWDTLDNIGKFNDAELLKNAGVRQHYLDAYCMICDKPLDERIRAYIQASKDFVPLIQMLNSNLFIQQEGENNKSFIARIKEGQKGLQNQQIYIQTRHEAGKKKENSIKALKKAYPSAKIIDQTDKDGAVANLETLLKNCIYRRRFSEIYQNIEYKVGLYCLLQGKNYTTNLAWDYFRRKHLLSAEEIGKWNEYKKLRNELSHQYMNEDINKRMYDIFSEFITDAIELEDKIDSQMPVVEWVKDDIYEAKHTSGRIVTIDFAQKKVLDIRGSYSDKLKYQELKGKEFSKKTKYYTEEYINGTSITTTGASIVSCQLNNGIEINFEKRQIVYSDDSKLYLQNQKRYLVSSYNEKIITDDHWGIIRYIIGNNDINIRKNENCRFNQSRQININGNNQISEEYWCPTHNSEKQHIKYLNTEKGSVLRFQDGTEVLIAQENLRIFHNGIELTYGNRRQFAESYNKQENIIPPHDIQRD